MSDAKTRAIEYVNRCNREWTEAMVKRDAIESCVSNEWKLAHAACKTASAAKLIALDHAYEVGALARPYWHVSARTLANYERANAALAANKSPMG